MEKENILKNISGISFVSILFTPTNSNLWISFLLLGAITGFFWFLMQ